MRDIARVLALAAEAGQFAGTLRIHGAALRLCWHKVTSYCRVATEASWTTTLGTMVLHAALGSDATVARVFAAFIATGEVEGTFIIGSALWTFTTHQRIAAVSVQAMAPSSVIEVSPTNGSRSALCETTRIHALLVNTSLVGGTFTIRSASQKVAVLQGVSSISLIADAQWPVELDMATRLWGADVRLLAWIAANLVDAGLVIGAITVTDAFRLGLWLR